MANTRAVHEVVCVVRARQLSLDEFYKYLTKDETNFEFDINAGSELNGMTILHAACAANNAELAEELILMGASVNKASNIGRTPLIEAMDAFSLSCVKLLLAFGANIPADQQFRESLKASTVEIQNYIKEFVPTGVIELKISNFQTRATQAKIEIVIQELEKMLENFKAKAEYLFNKGNAYKAMHLQSALLNAKAQKFDSVEAFLDYKKGDALSINEVISKPRIGFSEPTSKGNITAIVHSFRM